MKTCTCIIPFYNEENRIISVLSELLKIKEFDAIVLVNDGSTDNSWAIIQQLAESNPNVKALRFRRNYGKSPALNEGFKVVQGDVVITSGYSTIFPKGVMIGNVESVTAHGVNGFMSASVRLSVDFKRLSNVQVVRNLLKKEQLELQEMSENE